MSIHPTAILDESRGSIIVEESSNIGPWVILEGPCFVGDHCDVGARTTIGPRTILHGHVKIGHNVIIYDGVVIHRRARIGHGAIILPGACVSEYAVIGAGTVLRKNIPAYGVAYGVPGCLQKWMCSCGGNPDPEPSDVTNPGGPDCETEFVCPECGAVYEPDGNRGLKPKEANE